MIRANRQNIISILDEMKTQFDWATILKDSYEKNILPIALVDYNGYIRFSNSAMCSLLGYTSKELEELTWMQITVPKYLEIDLKLVNSCLRGSISNYKLYKEYYHKDGSIIQAMLYVTHLNTSSLFNVSIVPIEN